jgi:Conserved nitrate reductase-associated protein (Nitr_red_assoc)
MQREHAMGWNGIYAFDEADAALSLLPMAARRALDCAGLHLSLATWQSLSLATRQRLILLGAADSVDAVAVTCCLAQASAPVRAQEPLCDPAPDAPPPALAVIFASDCPGVAALWPRLRPLDRYVLAQLGARGKRERLAIAYAELAANSGE